MARKVTVRKSATRKKSVGRSGSRKEAEPGPTVFVINTTARVAAEFSKNVPDAATNGLKAFFAIIAISKQPFPKDWLAATITGYKAFLGGLGKAADSALEELKK